ncbi:hypothetical protein [Streptomyces sp. NPDC006551]|uniref:hypothetical protein n=1 Tax=Streptomyces sp. NPDC006551 TaxID=3157178 RepID=UPI0033BB8525
MFGAGVASADDEATYGSGNGTDPVLCHQVSHQGTVQNGLVNIADLGLGLLIGGGTGSTDTNQQICANGPVFAVNGVDGGSDEGNLL